mmetsp:Transcript_17525/g.38207  ORF Transcript_17525/g.38207 Transcript_17525/m.38207 type:complete len:784 (-) Transcript_17525:497-2848(-)
MSRRRGEFEHRTSIFEGAFRAWSHLGGIEPLDLETKATTDLDPLNFPLENDPRLAAQKAKKKKNDNNGGGGGDDFDAAGGGSSGADADKPKDDNRTDYPYEPLPRSGLAHPFVQAILSPWLGPDADQDAIQLGLTTLRTWWQHRRKGESGSAVVALGTDKMRGVVEGYTRHFFNLAHCLIVNDKEQPPRTLQSKMRDLEKSRNKKVKKRGREGEAIKAAAMAFIGSNPGHQGSGYGDPMGRGGQMMLGGVSINNDNSNVASLNGISPLERLHAAQRHQLVEPGGAHSNSNTKGGGILANALSMGNAKGRCIPGKVDLPKLVQQVSSSATQLAHRGTSGVSAMNKLSSQINNIDPSQYGDPNVTPIVVVSPNGNSVTKDIQFCMTINGITCAHCVKIVETVLKGCNGSRSPIEGLLDAVADMELHVVLVKIENIADVRRIAHEAARNLSMVGYTAVGKSVTVPDDMTLADVHYVFETTIPNVSPMMGFNWSIDCTCPDNTVLRRDCPRHSQMGPNVIEVFDKTKLLLNNFVQGCQKKTGVPCTAGVHCFCSPSSNATAAAASTAVAQQQQQPMRQPRRTNMFQNSTASQGNSNEYLSYQQPIQDSAPAGGGGGGGDNATGAGEGVGGAPSKRQRSSMSLHGRMSIGGLGGLSRHLSLTSETTFGRSMSGLSALSIDWENMEDFDVNVDHSAGINNDIINGQQQQQQQQGNQQGQNNLNQAVGQQQQGGGQDGAGAYGQQQMQQHASGNNMDGGQRFARRSSLIKKNTQGSSNGIYNVSFKEMMS